MSLSSLALVVYVFFQSASYLGWFAVSGTLLGIIGMVFVVLRVLEALAVVSYSVPVGRRHAAAE